MYRVLHITFICVLLLDADVENDLLSVILSRILHKGFNVPTTNVKTICYNMRNCIFLIHYELNVYGISKPWSFVTLSANFKKTSMFVKVVEILQI